MNQGRRPPRDARRPPSGARRPPIDPPGLLAQAPPFRQIDRLISRTPGESCVTLKRFTAAEELLAGAGTVPFSLVLEALSQGAAFLAETGAPGDGRIVRIDRAEMTAPVLAGDELEITAMLRESGVAGLKCECVGRVDQKVVARCELLIAR